MRKLYSKCKQLKKTPKMIVSAFTGTSILGQINVIETYGMDVEVRAPTYSSLSSRWTTETRIKDSLQGDFYGNT